MAWRPIDLPSAAEVADFSRRNQKKSRLLVDESLGPAVAALLREAGWNAKFVSDIGLLGRSDEDVVAFAQRDDRIVVTHDTDFLDDRRFPPHRNPGVLIVPGGSGEERTLVRALGQGLSIIGSFRELYRGSKVVVAADGTLTVRNREFETGAMKNTRYRFMGDGSVEEWTEV